MLFKQFKGDFYLAFVHVFGFNYPAAGAHFGVSSRTIKRWLNQNSAPMPVLRYLDSMARGYLPDYEPFASWYIDGTDILTPWGTVCAFEVEFLNTYKWNSRQYANLFQNNKQLTELKHHADSYRTESQPKPLFQFEVSYAY